jgi:predicted glycoside hydrolase/deacetylase ChbG (UPF0249 family)
VKRLVVCADDFGQSEPVDAGILRLARLRRLTAVSCLAQAPAFERDAPALLETGVDAGLHLDLTEGFGGAPPAGLGVLVLRSYLGAFDRAALRHQIAVQLDAFERVVGSAPAFVDGHRHVHQLPVVRKLLLDELMHRYRERPPLVRVTVSRRWRGAKATIIAALGGRALRRDLVVWGVPHNADFVGVYGFEPGARYRALVQGWLATLEDGAILMCHPGEASRDVISEARLAELAYLGSEDFEVDCAAAGVIRVGVGALVPPAAGRGASRPAIR